MKKWFAVLGLLPFMAAPAANAVTGDADAGAQKAAVCGACHGVDGNSVNPEWPKLAGQHASYVAAQLALFKQGQRVNVIMAPNAMILGEQDMADLAAYFARQPLQGLEADPSLLRGRTEALPGRRRVARIARLHRLPRSAGRGQRPGPVPVAARPAFRVHLRPAEGLRQRRTQAGCQQHHADHRRQAQRRGNAIGRFLFTGPALSRPPAAAARIRWNFAPPRLFKHCNDPWRDCA